MNKRILIIDDDPDILEAVKMLLEDEDYEVITSDKPEDLTLWQKNSLPAVILLDVLLSGSDGREYAQALKGSSEFKSIPIIMLSAHPNAKQTASQHGADEFLEKPFDIEDLLRLIKKYIP